MIVFIGDIHGQFEWLPNILKHVPKDATLIQVGDFGFWHGHPKKEWNRIWPTLGFEKPMYAIDGNHEYLPMFRDMVDPTEIWEGVIYLPRGTVLDIEGYKIGFMGGAGSIDYMFRMPGVSWFAEEQISDEQFDRLFGVDHIDILVTHAPPTSVARAHFIHPSAAFPSWGLPGDWFDPSQDKVERLWTKFGKPPLICGHMHRSIVHDTCRILDINEVYGMREGDSAV